MKLPLKSTLFILVLIILMGAGLRFYHLGSKSLWVDEIVASYVASGPDLKATNADIPYIINQRYKDVSPPLRDFIANYSFRIWGVNELGLRFFPACFGVLGILLIFIIARDWLKDEKTALLSALVFSILPFHIQHSQDGRMYTLFMFYTLASFYAMYKALHTREKRLLWASLYVILNSLSIYHSYFGFWALITQFIIGIYWIYFPDSEYGSATHEKKITLLSLFVGIHGIIAIIYTPWLKAIYQFIKTHGNPPAPYQVPFIQATPSTEVSRNFMYHLQPNFTFIESLVHEFGLPGISGWIMFALGILGTFYIYRDNSKRKAIGLALWIIIPIIITFAPPPKVLFFNRYICFILPIYILLVSIGALRLVNEILTRFRIKPDMRSTLSLIIISCLFTAATASSLINYYSTDKQPWRKAVRYIMDNAEDNDIVITGPYNANWCTLYYMQKAGAVRKDIGKLPNGGEWNILTFPNGKKMAIGEKMQYVGDISPYIEVFPRVWYITAYYRTYQYRNPAYYNYLESEKSYMEIFRGDSRENNIYVFLMEK